MVLHRLTVSTKVRRLALDRPLKLDLGCGPNPKAGWVNIDLARGADLRLDLREPLPLPSGCAEVVYSEHFFEHLGYPGEASDFLAERVLRLRRLPDA